MVPVESVDIEHIQQDGTTTSINNLGKQEEQQQLRLTTTKVKKTSNIINKQ